MSWLFGILFLVLGLIFIFAAYVSIKMERMLMERHPNIWIELGKPKFFSNNSIENNLSVWRFLRKREYEKTEDPSFIKVCQLAKFYNRAFLVLFAFTVVVFLLQL